jgi:hypothetical protein
MRDWIGRLRRALLHPLFRHHPLKKNPRHSGPVVEFLSTLEDPEFWRGLEGDPEKRQKLECELEEWAHELEEELLSESGALAARLATDTTAKAFTAAHILFATIQGRHGMRVAKKIFATLGAPSAKDRKEVRENYLRIYYDEVGKPHGWSMERCAQELSQKLASSMDELDLDIFGRRHVEKEALRKRFNRLVKPYKKKQSRVLR